MPMTKDEIKRNAPESATHYEPDLMFIGAVYIKYINSHPYYYECGQWIKCNSYFEAHPL